VVPPTTMVTYLRFTVQVCFSVTSGLPVRTALYLVVPILLSLLGENGTFYFRVTLNFNPWPSPTNLT